MLLQEGHLEHKSNRTGQTLRIGRAWLQDQLDDPAWHDLISRVASISCPMLFVHGQDDPTVSAADALELANAARAGEMRPSVKTRLILGANHVFNAPNPLPEGAPLPETLVSLIDGAVRFCAEATGADKD